MMASIMLFIFLGFLVFQWMWHYFILPKKLNAIPDTQLVPFLGLIWQSTILSREVIVTCILLMVFGSVIWNYFMLRKRLSAIPGPKSVPFLGLTWQMATIPREDRMRWFNDLCFKFKSGIVLTWIGTKPLVIINVPKYMEIVLSSSNLITKSWIYDAFRPWLGNGLVTATGETWFNHRRMIAPAFNFNILEEYAVSMRDKTEILLKCIESQLSKNTDASINIFELASKYTLDTICETAMGVNIDSQRKPDSEYVKALHTFARLSTERVFRFWLKWDGVYFRTSKGKECWKAIRTMQNFTNEVIEQKQYQRKNKSSKEKDAPDVDEFGIRKRKAFLDLLLDANENTKNPMAFREVREEVDTFMAGGHDTTGAAISWALFAIANEPEIQDKIHAEFKEVFGDETEMASTKQLGQLKYLDRVIKEVLRLYPSIPAISRCTDRDTEFGDYQIPKGTTLQLNIFQLHRNPDIWENPEKFDPDRFLPENIQQKSRYAYVPFSAGLRYCIGQKFGQLEMKIVLTEVLRRWRISSALKPSEMKMVVNFILRPHDERIQLYLTPA